MRLVVSTGGTGGHIYPALALAEWAVASGMVRAILFLGARDGLEGRIVPAHGFDIRQLPVGRIRGMGLRAKAVGLAGLARSVLPARKVLRDFRPDAVVGFGGFASAPALVAAAAAGIPTVLCEQNTIPGTTTRALAQLAARVCVSFQLSSAYLPSWKVVLTGNPVRGEIVAARQRREAVGRKGSGFRVLVLGGSQGAQFLNRTVARCLADVVKRHSDVSVVHQSGEGREGEAREAYGGVPRVTVTGFIQDMAAGLERASLVIGRAGATTVAELGVVGVPSLLVPFPFATDDHQLWNARHMERAGAARVFEQASFNEDSFVEGVETLRRDRELLGGMAAAAERQGIPDAAARVMELTRSLT